MISLAQVLYEEFSRSLDIGVVMIKGLDQLGKGPRSWDELPDSEKRRWRKVAVSAFSHVRNHDAEIEAERQRLAQRGDLFEQEVKRQIAERSK